MEVCQSLYVDWIEEMSYDSILSRKVKRATSQFAKLRTFSHVSPLQSVSLLSNLKNSRPFLISYFHFDVLIIICGFGEFYVLRKEFRIVLTYLKKIQAYK